VEAAYKLNREACRENNTLSDLGVNGGMLLRCVLKGTGCEIENWIELSQDRDHWRTLVNQLSDH
jgi:hypothetical protein